MVSRVKIEMMLLHEEDLLGFLDDLQAAGKAHMSVKRCTVARIERGGAALQPRLRAECLIDLVSIKGMRPT